MVSFALTEEDKRLLSSRGISEGEVRRQLELLRNPPPRIELIRPCTVGDGIKRLPEGGHERWLELHEEAASAGRFTKFVPASGAATRMFRTLVSFWKGGNGLTLDEIRRRASTGDKEARELLTFFEGLPRFAFYDDLRDAMAADGLSLEDELAKGRVLTVLEYLLGPKGLNYASLPKGLLKFHRYPEGGRTAFEEHLVEAAYYVRDGQGICRLHFTVSPEHRRAFEELYQKVRPHYEERFGVKFEVSFSEQSPSTDTIALDSEGNLFRLSDGTLLLRPGGHGALLGNLQALGGDLVYIKNIDNVVPDHLKPPTVHWKRVLGGYLVEMERELHGYLAEMADGGGDLGQILEFARECFCIELPEGWEEMGDGERRTFLLEELNRPLRVCGVVPNEGEPGGGPFWVRDRDGRARLQIVEEAQIDMTSPEQREIWSRSTHFNPVDIVCSLRDFKGRPFDLERFVDPEAVIITSKSKDGRPLKALERPGLWNGAMAGWLTVFVEVPPETFNPVKVVNDLLREAHQPR